MTQQRRFFIVKGEASHGTITHLCPTAAMALDTLERFQREAVQGIHIVHPDGMAMSPVDLETVVAGGMPMQSADLAEAV